MERASIDQLNSSSCLYDSDCTDSHLELGITSLGFDTVVDRKGNTVEASGYSLMGIGKKATSSDKKEVREQLEKDGYKCK